MTTRDEKLAATFDKVISILARLNPDDLDAFVNAIRAKKPRTAAHLHDALRTDGVRSTDGQ